MPERDFLTTREVAELLRLRPRRIYALAARGELPCSRATGRLLFPRREIEEWIRRRNRGAGPSPHPPADVLAGSHDPLLEWALRESGSGIASFFDGSVDGLVRVREGRAAAAGLHLFERDGEDWNRATVARECAGLPLVLVAWGWREQGLLLARAQAGKVRDLADVRGLRFVPRQPESGAWRLFLELLRKRGVRLEELDLLPTPARTETEVALTIASGQADAGFALTCLAAPFDLQAVPLAKERYDLLLHRWAFFEPPLQRLWRFTRSRRFAAKAQELGGYDVAELGRVQWNAPPP